ncbi:MAG: nuclear transport factor 2 family protein, partial [Flavisolibacter sp.]|nr:nuclear transport factor 2 family protein [Flavisolibacter sp.]
LKREVFTENLWFDMQSAGGGAPENKKAQDICTMWQTGLEDLDAVHHQAGHYLITVHEDEADIYAYAVATHFKRNAQKGTTRTFVGSYNLKAAQTANGWRLTAFQYNLKYMDGNTTLE